MPLCASVARNLLVAAVVGACGESPDAPCVDCSPDAEVADGGMAGADAPDAAPPLTVDCSPLPLADFYTRDVAVESAAPGTLLWCDREPGEPRHTGYLGYRVAYVTSTVQTSATGTTSDEHVVTTGVVWIPTTPAVEPRTLVVNAHGATGLVSRCAPSTTFQLDGAMFASIVPALPAPPVIAVPDYVGLGRDAGLRASDAAVEIPDVLDVIPPVRQLVPTRDVAHPYISLEGEGRAVVDLVRAARQLAGADLPASPRWVVVGNSQGGHAALATGEVVTRGYGDDTTLVAVVAGAPGTALADTTDVEPAIENMLTPMVIAGLSLEHAGVRATDYLTRQALGAFANTAGTECLTAGRIGAWSGEYARYLGPGSTVTRLPLDSAPLGPVLVANSPGHAPTAAPIFVGQVEGDPFIRPVRTRRYLALARPHSDVTYCEYIGDDLDRPWWERINNHNSFTWMFGAAPGACTDRTGAPVEVSATSFITRALAAP